MVTVTRFTLSQLKGYVKEYSVCPECHKRATLNGDPELIHNHGTLYHALLIPVKCKTHGEKRMSVAI